VQLFAPLLVFATTEVGLTGGGGKPKLLFWYCQWLCVTVMTKVLRFVVGGCLSLVLLYCGAGMTMGMLLGRNLPAFPFSWVDWLNRPNVPALLDHVINFILASMVGTIFKDMGRRKAALSKAQDSAI
jgi:hypothetical protein